MSLKETLQNDWKEAMKARNKFKADTISMVKAAILLKEKSGSGSLEDSDVIDVISKEVKTRRESITEFEKGNRQDLVEKAQNEIDVLLSYLPAQLSKEEISEIVEAVVKELGANSLKDMGRVMSAVTLKTKGRADGKLVSVIVKEHLNK